MYFNGLYQHVKLLLGFVGVGFVYILIILIMYLVVCLPYRISFMKCFFLLKDFSYVQGTIIFLFTLIDTLGTFYTVLLPKVHDVYKAGLLWCITKCLFICAKF